MTGMTIDSLRFSVAGLTLEKDDQYERLWRSPGNCATKLQFLPQAPPWTFDLSDAAGCTAFCQEEIGGAPLSMRVSTAGDCEVLYWLAKFWPDGSTGRFYVATLWTPFSDALARIDIAANEHGTTGVRESTVLSIGLQKPGMPASSDDEFYDSYFPAHPLTLVRTRLTEILDTFECVSDSGLTPFRVRLR